MEACKYCNKEIENNNDIIYPVTTQEGDGEYTYCCDNCDKKFDAQEVKQYLTAR